MDIGRIIAWVLILSGIGLAGFNGYQWWDQLNITDEKPKIANSITKNWNNKAIEKPLISVETVQPIKKNPSIKITTTQKQKTSHNQGNNIGQLLLPRINSVLPVVEGTDPDSLEKGVGKYVGYGTVSPDQTGHVVLSGHRDTVFRKVGKLKIGDRLYMSYQGNIYIYQIRKTWVTKSDDRTVIVPKNQPILTLTTCYPFDFVGSAPDRYIIESELIDIKKNSTTL